MRDAIKTSFFLVAISILVIFVIVPLLTRLSGLQFLIYGTSGVASYTLVGNLLLSLLPALCGFLLPSRPIHLGRQTLTPGGTTFDLAIVVWSCLFVALGGLTYRHLDALYGTPSRPALLNLILVTNNSMTIALVGRLLDRLSVRTVFAGLVYCFALILSGSRGLVLYVLMTIFFARWLSWEAFRRPEQKGHAHTFEFRQVRIGLGAIQDGNIFRPKYGIYALLLIATLGVWGAIRDDQSHIYFATLFRASEPYWLFALQHERQTGLDSHVFISSIVRIASIPTRWLGVRYPYTVDGSGYILSRYLNIPHAPGVSLPITFVGEGMLFAGYFGAIIYELLVLLFIFVSFRVLYARAGLSPNLKLALIAYQISKCVVLYPKSLSGAFLNLFYEGIRDYIILLVLSQFARFALAKDDIYDDSR